jgi:hypothetical protein
MGTHKAWNLLHPFVCIFKKASQQMCATRDENICGEMKVVPHGL